MTGPPFAARESLFLALDSATRFKDTFCVDFPLALCAFFFSMAVLHVGSPSLSFFPLTLSLHRLSTDPAIRPPSLPAPHVGCSACLASLCMLPTIPSACPSPVESAVFFSLIFASNVLDSFPLSPHHRGSAKTLLPPSTSSINDFPLALGRMAPDGQRLLPHSPRRPGEHDAWFFSLRAATNTAHSLPPPKLLSSFFLLCCMFPRRRSFLFLHSTLLKRWRCYFFSPAAVPSVPWRLLVLLLRPAVTGDG